MPSGGQSDEPGAGVRACLLRHARAHMAWVCSGPVEAGVEVGQGKVRHGFQGGARLGEVRRGAARLGSARISRWGMAGRGRAWHGKVR